MEQQNVRIKADCLIQLTYVGFGFYLVAPCEDGSAVVIRRLTRYQFGAFTISAGDLIALHAAADEMPRLESAVLIHTARTRTACLDFLLEKKQAEKAVSQESDLSQRIRRLAHHDGLAAMKTRRGGKWFFSDERNMLVSPEDGLDDEEAMDFLTTT